MRQRQEQLGINVFVINQPAIIKLNENSTLKKLWEKNEIIKNIYIN